LAALRASGIDVLELEPALRQARASQQVFLRTDTHWTPAGAQAAASAISTHIRAKGADWVDSASVSVAEGPQSTHSGDLLRYIPLGPFQDSMGPRPDELRTPVYTVAAGGDLFGEASIPATLVGTSYSDDVRWGFLGALQLALGADVLNAAAQGKGPFVSMAAYLDDESWRSTPPKLVIWEIPERYLGVAYDLSAFRAINTAAPAEK
jgi:alginate O-acetyltransferase complex protein AlgJ